MATALGNINPNRMELLRLKKRLTLAQRGHKLLKDKQEQLVRIFMSLVKNVKDLRLKVEGDLSEGYKQFISSAGFTDYESINLALLSSTKHLKIDTEHKPIMNLRVPLFKLSFDDGGFNHSFVGTSGDLDLSLSTFEELLPNMLKLSEMEKTLHMVSHELTSTRRRVSALEHVFIPQLLATIKQINQKLSELERSTATRLMKVKEIVRQH